MSSTYDPLQVSIRHLDEPRLREQRRLCQDEARRAREHGDREFARGARAVAHACQEELDRRERTGRKAATARPS